MSKPARSVESLKKLLAQINELAPKRSKASDGWIGDTKHAARHSDHNPEPDGTVDARDFTNDPNGGMDSQKLCDAIIESKDPRLSYIICNGKIISGRKGPKPWVSRKYNGANGHYHHIHVSVLDEGQDDKTPWKIESAFKKLPSRTITGEEASAVLKKGSRGKFVGDLQISLNKLGLGPLRVDQEFGPSTEAAVKIFQESNGLKVDGWAGPRTLEMIGQQVSNQKLRPKIDEAKRDASKANAKLDTAKKVVDVAASNGRVSNSEWLTGVIGAGGTVSVVKETVDTVTETTQSFGEMISSLGPWIILGLVIVGAALYIYTERRKQRLLAEKVKGLIE